MPHPQCVKTESGWQTYAERVDVQYHSSPHDSLHHSASGPQLRTATKGSHHQIAQKHRVVKDSDQWLSGRIYSATLAI